MTRGPGRRERPGPFLARRVGALARRDARRAPLAALPSHRRSDAHRGPGDRRGFHRGLAAATGVGVETLRAWEWRYGRPRPARRASAIDAGADEVAWVRLVAAAVGPARPSDVVGLSLPTCARGRPRRAARPAGGGAPAPLRRRGARARDRARRRVGARRRGVPRRRARAVPRARRRALGRGPPADPPRALRERGRRCDARAPRRARAGARARTDGRARDPLGRAARARPRVGGPRRGGRRRAARRSDPTRRSPRSPPPRSRPTPSRSRSRSRRPMGAADRRQWPRAPPCPRGAAGRGRGPLASPLAAGDRSCGSFRASRPSSGLAAGRPAGDRAAVRGERPRDACRPGSTPDHGGMRRPSPLRSSSPRSR
jgi:hypothetical protein